MTKLTLEEFHAALKAQGVPIEYCAFRCPACGTIQNAQDLIDAGAGKNLDEVEKYLAFSCVGRFTHAGQPPRVKGTQTGCDWTLGGLFRLHDLAVVTPDGVEHPRFELCTPEEARAHRHELLIQKIIRRAAKIGGGLESIPMRLTLDLETTHRNCPLALDLLLAAAPSDFLHDICGIGAKLDRETGQLQDGFMPRYAACFHTK